MSPREALRLDRESPTAELLLALVGGRGDAAALDLVALGALDVADLGARFEFDAKTAVRIFAAFELARRRAVLVREREPVFHSPLAVARWCAPAAADLEVEVFRVLVLDTRNRLISDDVVSRGILTASLVHPREVFRPALRKNGAAVIVVHNHPSGDPAPSAEDDAVTDRLAEAGQVLGIAVLDHIILAPPDHWSYREHGRIEGGTSIIGLSGPLSRPPKARGARPAEGAASP